MNKLNEEERRVIERKGTEAPYSGEYWNHFEEGIYKCRRCGAELFRSNDKFSSNCGWPSFDDEIEGAVKRLPDADGMRTEIICNHCGAHLGHVFLGEGFTKKNTRHCVNSLSLTFEPVKKYEYAYLAGGCFWGVEYYLEKLSRVSDAVSGYIGGDLENPDYHSVCTSKTGHLEAVRVEFDPAVISYEDILKKFFEIHDPTQLNHQGPDYGYQYSSAVFYASEEQRSTAEKVINILRDKGYNVVTELRKAEKFWLAEDYHQNYYDKTGKKPYCHRPVNRFD